MSKELIVDEAIKVYQMFTSALERAVMQNPCEQHRTVQFLISSYIDSESIDEFAAIAHSYVKSGRSDLHLRPDTEEGYRHWFRVALRHGYAGYDLTMGSAAQQVHNHIRARRKEKRIDPQIARILRMSDARVEESNRDDENAVKEFLLTSNYLLHHPDCSTKYLGGIVREIGDAFDDPIHSSEVLHTMQDMLLLGDSAADRFFDAYREINGV